MPYVTEIMMAAADESHTASQALLQHFHICYILNSHKNSRHVDNLYSVDEETRAEIGYIVLDQRTYLW